MQVSFRLREPCLAKVLAGTADIQSTSHFRGGGYHVPTCHVFSSDGQSFKGSKRVTKIILRLCLCVAACALTACVAPTHNYVPKATNISRPTIGEVSTASVGDEMVNQGVLFEREALLLKEDANIGLFSAYTLRHGYYLKQGENKTSDFYQPSPTPDGGRVEKAALADPYQSVQAYKGDSRICVVTVFNASACTKANFQRLTKAIATDESFQQTLIYSGKSGQKIKLGYREFSGNVARPAFSNDVEYDLSESSVVGYKGARIEVIEATNDHVTYRVISNFNAAR